MTFRKRLRRLRETTWKILTPADAEGGRYEDVSTAVSVLIFALIVLNVAATILGTVDDVQSRFGALLRRFELVSVLVFTAEYVLRVWSCTESTEHNGAVLGRLQFAGSFYAIIDLAAIAPFYMSVGLDLRFARVLRLLRIFRLVKAARYFSALRLFGEVARKKREEIVVSLALLGMLAVVASSLMYYAEPAAQPEVFGSIPQAVWWSVVTVTTVGYGNAAPVTVPGKVLGGIVALLGTGMGALPAGFLASGFSDALESRPSKRGSGSSEEEKEAEGNQSNSVSGDAIRYCPHCGSKLQLPEGTGGTDGHLHLSDQQPGSQVQDRRESSSE